MWRRRGKVMRLRIRRCQSSGLVLAVRGAKCNWVCVSFLVVSWRKAFNSPQITINKTTENGKALAKVAVCNACSPSAKSKAIAITPRSEEHTSELQSRGHLVCRLLLEKKK